MGLQGGLQSSARWSASGGTQSKESGIRFHGSQRSHAPLSGTARALLVVAILAARPIAALAEDLEPAVKAEFIDRFTSFIEWPAETFPTDDSPFVIGVTGDHPVAAHLRRMAEERTIKGRQILIRKLNSLDDLDGCHVVFIAGRTEAELSDILARTSTKPILTIADTPGFAQRGVLINLYRERKRVRFEINRDAAKRSGLKLSAKLLKLAKIVRQERQR